MANVMPNEETDPPSAATGDEPPHVHRNGRRVHGPDWRLHRAANLHITQTEPDAADDEQVRQLLELLRLRGGLDPWSADPAVWVRFPCLESALQIYGNGGDIRAIIESNIVRGASHQAVATMTGMSVALVETYCAYFFDWQILAEK